MAKELDIEKIRRDFPITNKVTFLASASVAPMPLCTIEAMKEMLTKAYIEYDKRYWEWEEDIYEMCRKAASKLINAEPHEIALVKSTTDGINAFASGIKWKQGDNIVINDLEYPANVIPWYNQARRHGLKVKIVKSTNSKVLPESIANAIDNKTRVISVSHVEFGSGFKHNLKELSRIAHENNIFLFVDAIQSIGAIKVDVKELDIDALSAGGYKWMCGPIGTGIAYIKKDLINRINPSYVGFESIDEREAKKLWNNLVKGFPYVKDYRVLASSARRFEYGSMTAVGFKGLQTSIEYLLDLGVKNIEDRITMLVDYLIKRLEEKEFKIQTPVEKEHRAGIVNFKPHINLQNKHEFNKLYKRLLDTNVRVDIREGGIRVACHIFNTEDDIDRLLGIVS